MPKEPAPPYSEVTAWRCELCGLTVREMVRFRRGECPENLQHQFVPVEWKGMKDGGSGRNRKRAGVGEAPDAVGADVG